MQYHVRRVPRWDAFGEWEEPDWAVVDEKDHSMALCQHEEDAQLIVELLNKRSKK